MTDQREPLGLDVNDKPLYAGDYASVIESPYIFHGTWGLRVRLTGPPAVKVPGGLAVAADMLFEEGGAFVEAVVDGEPRGFHTRVLEKIEETNDDD